MFRLSSIALLAFLMINQGCSAPQSGFFPFEAGQNQSNLSRLSTTEAEVFAKIEGNYVLGPHPCNERPKNFVVIAEGTLIDQSGKIDPNQFRIDRIYKGIVDYGNSSTTNSTGVAYFAYTYENDGSFALAVFTELPKEDWISVKSEYGFHSSTTIEDTTERNPLIFTRTKFDHMPSQYEVQHWLRTVPDDQIQVFEPCN